VVDVAGECRSKLMPNPPEEYQDRYGVIFVDRLGDISCGSDRKGTPEILVLGNREGMLSLANVLLWLHANSWRREFISLSALPFISQLGEISLSLNVVDEDGSNDAGWLVRRDKNVQYEWMLSEDELRYLALAVHHLACRPEVGYQRLPNKERGDAWVRFELFSNRDRATQ
jgi:hypothetical protein